MPRDPTQQDFIKRAGRAEQAIRDTRIALAYHKHAPTPYRFAAYTRLADSYSNDHGATFQYWSGGGISAFGPDAPVLVSAATGDGGFPNGDEISFTRPDNSGGIVIEPWIVQGEIHFTIPNAAIPASHVLGLRLDMPSTVLHPNSVEAGGQIFLTPGMATDADVRYAFTGIQYVSSDTGAVPASCMPSFILCDGDTNFSDWGGASPNLAGILAALHIQWQYYGTFPT